MELPEEVLAKVRDVESREATILELNKEERRVVKSTDFVIFEFQVDVEFQKIGFILECVAQSANDKFRIVVFDEEGSMVCTEHSTPSADSSQVIIPFGPFERISFEKPIYNKTAIRHRIPEVCLKLLTMRQGVELSPKGRHLVVFLGANRMRSLNFAIRILPLRFVSIDVVSDILDVDKQLIRKWKELEVYKDFESWESIRTSADEIRDLLAERWLQHEKMRDSCLGVD